MSSPLFSIIVPTFNHALFLPDALASIAQQSFANWEAIIVDDGSSDNTNEVAAGWTKKDPRFIYHHKQNGGLSSARNAGIRLARGSYLAFLDADDILFPDYLKIFQQNLTETSEWLQSGYACVDSSLTFRKYQKRLQGYPQDLYSILQASNIGPVNSFVIKRTVVDRLGSFDEKLTSCEDWDFWLRCAREKIKLQIVPDVLTAYRYVSDSMGKNSLRMLEQGIILIKRNYGVNSALQIREINDSNTSAAFRNAFTNYLFTCIGIALFQSNKKSAETIMNDYIAQVGWKLSWENVRYISNYQTYRDLRMWEYFKFFKKNIALYRWFFSSLRALPVFEDNKEGQQKILPEPMSVFFRRAGKKISGSLLKR